MIIFNFGGLDRNEPFCNTNNVVFLSLNYVNAVGVCMFRQIKNCVHFILMLDSTKLLDVENLSLLRIFCK